MSSTMRPLPRRIPRISLRWRMRLEPIWAPRAIGRVRSAERSFMSWPSEAARIHVSGEAALRDLGGPHEAGAEISRQPSENDPEDQTRQDDCRNEVMNQRFRDNRLEAAGLRCSDQMRRQKQHDSKSHRKHRAAEDEE